MELTDSKFCAVKEHAMEWAYKMVASMQVVRIKEMEIEHVLIDLDVCKRDRVFANHESSQGAGEK